MRLFPKSLQDKLALRKVNNSLRSLKSSSELIDFASNDYLGFAHSEIIFDATHQFLIDSNIKINGATGSRLISGNYKLYSLTEDYIAKFHLSESALIFNSGYDANVGFFSCVPQRNDIILFDELCHASIRDGIQLSNARSFKFMHNDFEDLEQKILKFQTAGSNIFVAIESVYSMDGDTPNLEELIFVCEKHNCLLIVDEAHALGVFGDSGEGLIQSLGFQDKVFARIMTFGKGLGCHGAAILGSQDLKDYLVNFARSFIYTTGLSPHSVATVLIAYQQLVNEKSTIEKLRENIVHFNQEKNLLGLKPMFVRSKSAIQCAIIPGNEKVKKVASQLQSEGFDVKAILSPTVPEGQERLRICLHSYNSKDQISSVLRCVMSLL
ncbi:pyridoxal phosphate-dependent aminotransferase family protein [Flavobacterium amniphilum]|uniref:aminotransferase class I/II-fold pyridoxal phosphate-dependent enzyme n=1 Tax=Flavobacterium amniphilum TaxID=1834035 RepID=UPI00202A896B|nr:pyridoxal phosphate-dependent aminotransferase family protein [Flavobacterium amniphilum]MCL9803919.1 pyridoxal phosphate-dependent aminotransferase family protein [Flavobacterium amniphilum]